MESQPTVSFDYLLRLNVYELELLLTNRIDGIQFEELMEKMLVPSHEKRTTAISSDTDLQDWVEVDAAEVRNIPERKSMLSQLWSSLSLSSTPLFDAHARHLFRR